MKKHLVILFLTLASWSMATPAYADQQFVPLATIPGLNDNVSPTSAGIAIFLNNLYTFAIGIAVILAIAMIIWGGLEYSLSEAITSKSAGRKRITQALFGLVLVLSPVVVFTIINPKILSLNVNFPALNTQFGDYAGSSSTSVDTPGVGGSETPRTGQWCYTQANGRFACNTSQAGCQLSYDAAIDPDRGDPSSPPKSTCQQS